MAKKTLLFTIYNNYFNRTIKKLESLNEIVASCKYNYVQETAFNENDGINTKHIVNWNKNFTPDYCIVLNEHNQIDSKWFVLDFTRTRCGQYEATLKRDVISDFYEETINAPCFVQKGFVTEDNPLIFNKEDFNCNQIKTNELLLKDETKRSWLVLYFDINSKNSLNGTINSIDEPYINTGASTLADWSVYANYHDSYKIPNLKLFAIRYRIQEDGIEYFGTQDTFNSECELINSEFKTYTAGDTGLVRDNGGPSSTKAKKLIKNNSTSIKNALSSYKEPSLSFSNFMKYNNKIVKTNDNKYWRINIVPSGLDVSIEDLSSGSLYSAVEDSFKTGGVLVNGWSGDFNGAIVSRVESNVYKMQATEITSEATTYTYDFRNAPNLLDQPYGIICLPYLDTHNGTDVVGFVSDVGNGNVKEGISMLVAADLCKGGVGSGHKIFDAQILPYCPANVPLAVGNILKLSDYNNQEQISLISSGGNNYGFALFPYYAKFTKNIDVRTPLISDFHFYKNYKLENQLSMYRLCSPNFNGQFEFSMAKNRGLDYINIDCTYKPYAPYIHLNPKFKGLYGQDFDDARGLICSGDFSMTVTGDAFEQYKLQNKNYNEIFNRQIENLDTNHNIGILEKSLSLLTNTTAGAIGGGIAGKDAATMGLGAVSGLINAGIGLATNEMSFAEQKDYSKDMHEYQLDNIKALPSSLAKVDAYNNNNKLFPILEKYTCTDKEKEIFENKLKFEGMTINALGTIKDYMNFDGETFVRGQIIRLNNIQNSSKLCYTIYEEISKGVYL